MDRFDLIVIGAGPGGYVAAIKAAKGGMNVAIVENIRVGGTCLNRGCIPAKAMIHASSLYKEMISDAEEIGINAGSVAFDYQKIIDYKNGATEELVNGVEALLEGNGITKICGKAVLEKDRKVTVTDSEGNTSTYEGDKIILATGSVPALIPVPGIDLPGVLTSDGVFSMKSMPESMVIIGGGVIGVEFATVFSNLGARVTIIEALPRILDNMDKEISQNLKMIFKKSDIDVHTGSIVKSIESGTNGLKVIFDEKDKPAEATGQIVICAAGRKPNLNGLFGEGVEIAMAGNVIDTGADRNFQTNIPGVYAIGDIVHGPKLAHTASAHGILCVEHILGEELSLNPEIIPAGVYSDPEIAQVGITEAEAKEKGIPVKTGKFIMSANGKSIITREERGFIKIVADDETDKIIGAQLMCARATDMISELSTAIANGLTVQQMLKVVRPHPTYNEGITEALEDVIGESLHTMPRNRKKKD